MGAVVDTGPDLVPQLAACSVGGPTARLAIDTYDQPFFPTRGVKLDATHFEALRVAESDNKYSRTEARLGAALAHRRFGPGSGGLEGGTTLKGTLPLGDAFALGGPRRLSGFAQGPATGRRYMFGRVGDAVPPAITPRRSGASRSSAGVTAEAGKHEQALHRNDAHRMAAFVRGVHRRETRSSGRSTWALRTRRTARAGSTFHRHPVGHPRGSVERVPASR